MLFNLPPCDTWACINSFSSWISLILTIVVSGASLIISILAFRYTRKKDAYSAKISVETGILMPPGVGVIEYLSVTITNDGFRSLQLNSFAWNYKELFGKPMQLITNLAKSLPSQLSSKLPIELKEGHQATFYAERDIFVSEDYFLKSQNTIQAWYRIRTLKITAKFSTYNHTEPVPGSIKKMIWQQYKNARAS